jgi:hypothetical protein
MASSLPAKHKSWPASFDPVNGNKKILGWNAEPVNVAEKKTRIDP